MFSGLPYQARMVEDASVSGLSMSMTSESPTRSTARVE